MLQENSKIGHFTYKRHVVLDQANGATLRDQLFHYAADFVKSRAVQP